MPGKTSSQRARRSPAPARFVMDFGGRKVTAELLSAEAPNVARAFRDSLPNRSFSVHAKFAGEELIVMVPFHADPENEIFDVKPGDIGYYPGRQTICIFYGKTKPFGHVSVFARVTDGLGALKTIGRTILERGPVKVALAPA
ncbi:MAG: cyclophilin-like fold protein [Alphaproteobacteria bacterium]